MSDPRCEGCGTPIGAHGRIVRVVECVRLVTRTIEGCPAETEMAPVFAGIYCSAACAASALSDLSCVRAGDA